MCEALDVSTSGYYDWRGRGPSDREKQDAELLEVIEDIWEESRQTYGSPRIHREMKDRGITVGRNRVARLMRDNGIEARQAQATTKTPTYSAHDKPTADNLLEREFEGHRPDEVWLTDITYIDTREDWLYLAGVLDCATREIVGWSMDTTKTEQLICDALQMAVNRREPQAEAMHHSDRGSQYAGQRYQQRLADLGMKCSMSRKGDCWDNAPKESFFGTLKNELTAHYTFQTTEAAKDAIFDFIEIFYNRQRSHSALGYQSPIEYRKAYSA